MTLAIKRKYGERIDYTPVADVVGGTPIVLGSRVYIADRDIPANTLDCLATEGIYDVVKATSGGSGWSDRAPIFWDDTNKVFSKTPTVGYFAGYAIGASADADATARILICSDGPAPTVVVAPLTDSTTGTASAVLAATPATYSQTYLANSLASLAATQNLVLSALKNSGQMSST